MRKVRKAAGAPAPRGRHGLRRKRYLVNRLPQLRFSFKLLVHVGAFYLAAGILVWRETSNFLTMLKDIPASTDTEMAKITTQILSAKGHFLLFAVVMSVLATVYILVAGVYASHRLNGPLPRLGRHIAEALFKPGCAAITFRKGDHLDELARQLNATSQAAGQRRQQIAATVGGLSSQARQLQRAATSEQAQGLLEEMEEQLRHLTATMEIGAESASPSTDSSS